ncbi:MAG: cyclic nucleotide-binding domain-containing protein [Acidimicrobiia bacterium]|nr:cyclic nucleotide-binding domain-containing protein [Acidimicrobiia bacterium]
MPEPMTPSLVLASLDGIQHATVVYTAGSAIVTEGDQSDHVAIIAEGAAKVTAGSLDYDLASLGPGDVIGEVSALAGGERTATVTAETDVVVHEFDRHAFDALLEKDPSFAEAVTHQAAARLDRRHMLAFLERLLGHLEPDVIADFDREMEWIDISAGDTLFDLGEIADSGYFLISGRLQELAPDIDGELNPSREIARDEIVGETGLFRGAQRTSKVVAARDSRLVKIGIDNFMTLINQHPAALVPVVTNLARRIPTSRQHNRQRTISVCVTADVDSRLFASRLTDEMAALGSTAHLWSARVDTRLGRSGVAQSRRGEPGDSRVIELIHEHELDHTYLLCEADRAATEWTLRAARQADYAVAVIDPRPGDAARDTVTRFLDAASDRATKVVVVLHPIQVERPRGTRATVEAWEPDWIIQVRIGAAEDIGRMSRILAGHATALVLGGGGARGYAHIGVSRAMHELGIPVDLIGGSSIGSPLGALVAMETPVDQLTDVVHSHFSGIVDYTIPIVSLAKGERLTTIIDGYMGSWDIEDLWRPFFCLSTNLTEATEVVHDSGNLARSIRASVAIPGVFPPVAFGEDLHVDAGVLNNLPGDIMRRRHPTSTIIAVDVAPSRGPRARGEPALSVSGWQALISAASKTKNEHHGLATMLLRTMITASVRQRKRSVERGDIDLYLDLDLRGVSLLDFDSAPRVAPLGYEAAMPRLEAWLAERQGA